MCLDDRPRTGYAYIYAVTHLATSMRYIGYTEQSLSHRWANYCRDSASYAHGVNAGNAHPRAAALYGIISESGPTSFAIRALEQCPVAIKRQRELDYMRMFETWLPSRGYNSPSNRDYYARKLCFLLHPSEERDYYALLREREHITWDDGDMVAYKGKYAAYHARWVDIGMTLMATIPTLAMPVVTLSN